MHHLTIILLIMSFFIPLKSMNSKQPNNPNVESNPKLFRFVFKDFRPKSAPKQGGRAKFDDPKLQEGFNALKSRFPTRLKRKEPSSTDDFIEPTKPATLIFVDETIREKEDSHLQKKPHTMHEINGNVGSGESSSNLSELSDQWWVDLLASESEDAVWNESIENY